MREKLKEPFAIIFAILLVYSIVNFTMKGIVISENKSIDQYTSQLQKYQNDLYQTEETIIELQNSIEDTDFMSEQISIHKLNQEKIKEIKGELELLDQKIEKVKDNPYLTVDELDKDFVLSAFNIGNSTPIGDFEHSDWEFRIVDDDKKIYQVENVLNLHSSVDFFLIGNYAIEIGEVKPYYYGLYVKNVVTGESNSIHLGELDDIDSEEGLNE